MRDFVSFGGGVQSTVLALLVMEEHPALMRAMGGGLPEAWLFANTGDEPDEVYAHVAIMRERILAAGMGFETVSAGHLSKHVIERASEGLRGISMPPMYVATRDGGSMPVRRGCTRDYKAKPLDQHIRKRFEVPRGYKGEPFLRQWYGISADEAQRMRESQDRWRVFDYPLVRMGWTRDVCQRYLLEKDVPAPRSACVFCPFHNQGEWKRILANPVERERVFAFEKDVHAAWEAHGSVAGLETKPYLHPSRIPIDEVDFDGGQQSLWASFDNECAGVCGV